MSQYNWTTPYRESQNRSTPLRVDIFEKIFVEFIQNSLDLKEESVNLKFKIKFQQNIIEKYDCIKSYVKIEKWYFYIRFDA